MYQGVRFLIRRDKKLLNLPILVQGLVTFLEYFKCQMAASQKFSEGMIKDFNVSAVLNYVTYIKEFYAFISFIVCPKIRIN